METIIVQPAITRQMDALKAFLIALKIDFKTASEDAGNPVTNQETVSRIQKYEYGAIMPNAHRLNELKDSIDKTFAKHRLKGQQARPLKAN